MRKIALLSGCLLALACSDGGGGTEGEGGHAGSQAGSGGSGGTAGRGGSGGTSGSAGQAGGNTGSGGSAGQAGGSAGQAGGSAGGSAGSAGRGGSGGSAGVGGSAGRGGSGGGTAGTGGQSGRGGTGGNGQSCLQIEADYVAAIVQARMCQANLTVVQCTHLVSTALSCGCEVWVNNTTELDRIKAQWTAAGCTPGIVCPAIACPNPGTRAACVPINSGDFCMGTTLTPAN